jgi:acyl transferase domain-containing protein
VEAQANVIKKALRISQVEPETITYIETHGTGTPMGDIIEMEALNQAFKPGKKGSCALGSVKTNIGHLDAAAGAASFIKTVLALKNRLIPPSLNFETLNPRLDFENSPFYVITEPGEWRNDDHPLRAGVSSFGIGGTNAHIVLEEAPVKEGSLQGGDLALLLFSARTAPELDRVTENFAAYLQENPAINLADAAYTLQVGRRAFKHRKMALCADRDEAVRLLSTPGSRKVHQFAVEEENNQVVFMFSGLGSQYVNMGLELYQKEPVFREEMDRCFDILKP